MSRLPSFGQLFHQIPFSRSYKPSRTSYRTLQEQKLHSIWWVVITLGLSSRPKARHSWKGSSPSQEQVHTLRAWPITKHDMLLPLYISRWAQLIVIINYSFHDSKRIDIFSLLSKKPGIIKKRHYLCKFPLMLIHIIFFLTN